VSGPEIMDKFVGSSEKNLRAVFDDPPDVYDFVKNMPNGEAIAKAVRYCLLYHVDKTMPERSMCLLSWSGPTDLFFGAR
jgi:hypothetical protein